MVKAVKHTIKCDLCGRDFHLTKEVLKDHKVTLKKDGLEPHDVTLTLLTCPACGKSYPVIMDDEKTLPILEKMRNVMAKQAKLAKAGKSSPELAKKYRRLNWKLDFNRRELAEKYNGSLYQREDGIVEQLDYRYRTR